LQETQGIENFCKWFYRRIDITKGNGVAVVWALSEIVMLRDKSEKTIVLNKTIGQRHIGKE
jgi:hypothetical protein